MKPSGPALYVHVPFCTGRCLYCDFSSEVLRPLRVEMYLEALRTEIQLLRERHVLPRKFATVYIGGGTPSSLSPEALKTLFQLVCQAGELSSVEEWTVEANPETADGEKLALLRELGADRLSLGVQSFEDRFLRVLGRRHSGCQAEEAFRAARRAGFSNISLDLIFAIPGQSLEDFLQDVRDAVALGPEHVSAYGLSWEEGTPFYELLGRGELEPVPESLQRQMYLAVIEALEAAGFGQYEISNFARPGRHSRHNILYWLGGEYVGLGPSAASYLLGERLKNAITLDEYAAALRAGRLPVAERERLDPERASREALVLALRTRCGVQQEEFRARTGFSIEELLGPRGRYLLEEGWLELVEGSLRLTLKALPVADSILAELVA